MNEHAKRRAVAPRTRVVLAEREGCLPAVSLWHGAPGNASVEVVRSPGSVSLTFGEAGFADATSAISRLHAQLQLADELVAQRERQRDEANESVRILAHAMTEVANRLETVRGTAGQLDEFRPLVHKLRETMNACTTEAQRSGGTFVAVDPASPHSDGAVVTGVRHPDGKVTITSATAGTAPRVGRCEHRSHEHNDTDGGGCSKCSCPRSYGEVVAQGMCGPPEDHHTADNHRCRCGKLEKQDSPGCFWHHGDDGSRTSAAECATEGGCKLGDARPVAAEAAPWSLRRWAFVAKGTMEAQAANLEEVRSLAARLDGWRTSPSGRLIAHTVEILSTMASNYPDDEEAMRREVEEAQANHHAVIDLTRTMREAAVKIDALGIGKPRGTVLDEVARMLLAEADAWSDTKGPEPEGDLNGDYLANVQAARGPIAFQAPGWSAPVAPLPDGCAHPIGAHGETGCEICDCGRRRGIEFAPTANVAWTCHYVVALWKPEETEALQQPEEGADHMPKLPDHLLHSLSRVAELMDRCQGSMSAVDRACLVGYRHYLRWVIGEGQ